MNGFNTITQILIGRNPEFSWIIVHIFVHSSTTSDDDNDSIETSTNEEEEEKAFLEEKDQLFVFDIDGYLESQSVTIDQVTHLNCNNGG